MNKELIAKLRMAAGTEISKLHQNKVFTDRELFQLSNLLIPPLNGGNGIFDEFMRKYTEVIVQECANRATWAQDTGAADIGGEVLRHFGVSE